MFLFNPWHNGQPVYNTSSMGGACFKTMLKVAESEPAWKTRADYLLTRVPEEFFDLRSDPHCLINLIEDEAHWDQIGRFKGMLAEHLKQTEDPMTDVFATWTETKSVARMVETYAAMWETHGIPGRVARNPVDMGKWSDTPNDKPKKQTKPTKPTDEERKAKRAARRAAAKKDGEK